MSIAEGLIAFSAVMALLAQFIVGAYYIGKLTAHVDVLADSIRRLDERMDLLTRKA